MGSYDRLAKRALHTGVPVMVEVGCLFGEMSYTDILLAAYVLSFSSFQ